MTNGLGNAVAGLLGVAITAKVASDIINKQKSYYPPRRKKKPKKSVYW